MEFEKLVKLARHCSVKDACIECSVGGCSGPTGLMSRLADAIEELSKRAEEWEALHDLWKAGCEGLQERVPCWIPVTEPPKEDGWYQVYAPGYSSGSSSGLKNINGNMYSAFKHGKWSIEVGYHKRPGCVKAWMPLPEPPVWLKEETR